MFGSLRRLFPSSDKIHNADSQSYYTYYYKAEREQLNIAYHAALLIPEGRNALLNEGFTAYHYGDA